MKIAIAGAGIIGLSVARALLKYGFKDVIVLEKESRPAIHQTSRNSGVIHAGLYYMPGSLKSSLCRDGITKIKAYCKNKNINFQECGKLVVATDESEIPRLYDLFERGKSNNLRGIELLTRSQALKVEPYVNAREAILVPEESIVNYSNVAKAYSEDIVKMGGNIVYNSRISNINLHNKKLSLLLNDSEHVIIDQLICSAGLYADKLSEMAGLDLEGCKIVPFRGEYYLLRPEYTSLVNNLIYPVPNPNLPFLGVHLTKMINGKVEAGPNAILALAREGYTWQDINLYELFEAASFSGLQSFVRKYPMITFGEVARSLSKPLFVKSLQRLVPDIRGYMLEKTCAGVRAQLMNLDGSLEQDFKILSSDQVLSILNAPSPAATSSLAIADYVLKCFLNKL